MKELGEKNFGLVIAFLLPGFICLWGVGQSNEAIAALLSSAGVKNAPTVGGFLYATLASLAMGLLISAVRWLIVDHVLEWMDVRDKGLKFENLKDEHRYTAFLGAVENHYRYYQYYANTLVSVVIAFVVQVACGESPHPGTWFGVIGISVALFMGSRDALKKYFDRAEAILK